MTLCRPEPRRSVPWLTDTLYGCLFSLTTSLFKLSKLTPTQNRALATSSCANYFPVNLNNTTVYKPVYRNCDRIIIISQTKRHRGVIKTLLASTPSFCKLLVPTNTTKTVRAKKNQPRWKEDSLMLEKGKLLQKIMNLRRAKELKHQTWILQN